MKDSLVVRFIFHFFWIIIWRKSRVIAVGRGRAFQKGVNYNDAWLYSCKCLILFSQDQPIGRRDVDQQKIHAVWNSISFFPHRISAQVLVKDLLPPFSLIRDFRKQNTRGNVSKISVNHACYRQIGSKSTNHSPLAWRKEGQKVTLVVVIGGFRSDLSITHDLESRVSTKTVVKWLWLLSVG